MVRIRQMEFGDLEQVMPIERANFSVPWTENGFLAFMLRQDALFLVAEENEKIVGYCGVLIAVDEGDITNVCVEETARGRGIGRRLVEELMRETQQAGVVVWHLEVRAGNAGAIRLYEKLGFERVGCRKGYYEEPREDAVLMSRRLQQI